MRPHLSLALLLLVACRSEPKPESEEDGISGVDSGLSVDADGDGFDEDEDCDDADASVNPAAAETCDERDNDCDGTIDEDVLLTFFADRDADGAGDPTVTAEACVAPAGMVDNAEDCDDLDPDSHPGAAERCDGEDNDCDGDIDEEVRTEWFADTDDDGFGDAERTLEDCDPPDGYVADNTDCDDLDADSHPGATEWCDAADNDCNGLVDDDARDAATFFEDADADGYGTPTSVTEACSAPSGFVVDDSDCDDSRAEAFPGADELCNGLDDDCDADIDDNAIDATTWYVDVDGDGYGSDTFTTTTCDLPSGFQADATDCDDGDAAIHPAATELCDGVDNDCDATIDEDDAADATTWYADTDSDGFGDASSTTVSCELPAGFSDDATDCDDGDATVHPGSTATETPGDGIDQDCDGNDLCTDLNCDGLPDLFVGSYYSGSGYTADQQLFYNTGSGYATTEDAAVSATGTWSTLVEDVDEDGFQDLLLVNYYSGSSYYTTSYLYWGSATGYSSSSREDLVTYGAILADIGDFDGDGVKDIAFGHHYPGAYSGSSYVYYGSGRGFSTGDMASLPTAGTYGVVAEDLDADGYDDLVYCNYYNGSSTSIDSYVYYGSASGLTTSNSTALETDGCRDALAEDLDGDGYTDLVFANYYENGVGYATDSFVYYGSASGFSELNREELPTQGTLGVDSGDFDGDGYTDLAFSGYYDASSTYWSTSYIYYGTATGYSTSRSDSLSSVGAWSLTAGDLNSDGYDDLVIPSYIGSGYYTSSHVHYGSASGFTGTPTSLDTIGASQASIGDLDGDGHPEVVFNNYYSGSWSSVPDTYIYWGSSGAYSESNRTDLDTYGSWAKVQLVGATDW